MINMRFYRVIDYTRLNGIKETSHCLNTMWIWISHGFTGHRPMMNWLGASNIFLVFQPCKSDVWLRWLHDIFLGWVKNHQPVNQLNMIQHVRKIGLKRGNTHCRMQLFLTVRECRMIEDGETYHTFWMWLSLPRIAFPNSVSCSD